MDQSWLNDLVTHLLALFLVSEGFIPSADGVTARGYGPHIVWTLSGHTSCTPDEIDIHGLYSAFKAFCAEQNQCITAEHFEPYDLQIFHYPPDEDVYIYVSVYQ